MLGLAGKLRYYRVSRRFMGARAYEVRRVSSFIRRDRYVFAGAVGDSKGSVQGMSSQAVQNERTEAGASLDDEDEPFEEKQTKEMLFSNQLRAIDRKRDQRSKFRVRGAYGEEIPIPEGGWTAEGVSKAIIERIRMGETHLAFDYVEHFHAKNPEDAHLSMEVYNYLLKALVEEDIGDLAFRLLDEILYVRNMTPDVTTYNCILEMHGRKDVSNMIQAAQEMSGADIEPNLETYHILIRFLSKLSNLTACENVLENMQAAGMEATGETYKILIDSFIMQGRYEDAEQSLSNAINDGKAEAKDVLGSALYLYAHQHDIDRLEKLFQALVSMDGLKEVDVSALDAMFYALLQNKDISLFLTCLELCAQAGTFPSYAVIQCAGNQLSTSRHDDTAFDTLRRCMESAGVKPGMVLINQMLQAHTTSGNIDSALEVFEEANTRKLQVDLNALQALLRSLCRQSKSKEIWDIIGKLESMRLPFTISTFTTVVSALWEYSRGVYVKIQALQAETKTHDGFFNSPQESGQEPVDQKMLTDGKQRIQDLVTYTLTRWPGVIPRLAEQTALQFAVILWRWRLIEEFELLFERYPSWSRDCLAKLVMEISQSKALALVVTKEEERLYWHRMIKLLMNQHEPLGPFGYMTLMTTILRDNLINDEETVELMTALTHNQIDKDPNGVSGEMGRMYLGYALEEPLLRLRIIPNSDTEGTQYNLIDNSESGPAGIKTVKGISRRIPKPLKINAHTFDVIVRQWARDGNARQVVNTIRTMMNRGFTPTHIQYRHLANILMRERISKLTAPELSDALDIVSQAVKQQTRMEDKVLTWILSGIANLIEKFADVYPISQIRRYLAIVHREAPDPGPYEHFQKPSESVSFAHKPSPSGFGYFLRSDALNKLHPRESSESASTVPSSPSSTSHLPFEDNKDGLSLPVNSHMPSGLLSSPPLVDLDFDVHPLTLYLNLHKTLSKVPRTAPLAINLAIVLMKKKWMQTFSMYHELTSSLDPVSDLEYLKSLTSASIQQLERSHVATIFARFLRRFVSSEVPNGTFKSAMLFSVEEGKGLTPDCMDRLVLYFDRTTQVRILKERQKRNETLFDVLIRRCISLQLFDITMFWLKIYHRSNTKTGPISPRLVEFLFKKYRWSEVKASAEGNERFQAHFDLETQLADIGVDIYELIEKEKACTYDDVDGDATNAEPASQRVPAHESSSLLGADQTAGVESEDQSAEQPTLAPDAAEAEGTTAEDHSSSPPPASTSPSDCAVEDGK